MGGRDATMVLLDENGIRCDGRKIDEPRKIVIKAGGLKNADGDRKSTRLTPVTRPSRMPSSA